MGRDAKVFGRNETYAISSIVNYLRRSRQDVERERRTGEDTLAEQQRLMERVLSEYGIPYVQRMEIGSGDKISTRPVFQEVLGELAAGVYDAIAVKELSRLGRGSYADMGKIYDLLRERRVFIITPWRIYDPTNASDARQIRFELFLSREEFETTRERLIGARYNYAMQGKWMAGSVPYGYRFNASSQRLQPYESEAEVVRLIFSWYAEGIGGRAVGPRAIATELGRLGIVTANGLKAWQPEVIRRILGKSVYIGKIGFRVTEKTSQGVRKRPRQEWIEVDGAHPPLVSEDLFGAAQAKLKKGDRRPPARSDRGLSALAGLIKCGNCGRALIRRVSVRRYARRDGGESVYRSAALRCPQGCVTVPYDVVEAAVKEALRELPPLPREGVLDALQLAPGSRLGRLRSGEAADQPGAVAPNGPDGQINLNRSVTMAARERVKELRRRLNRVYERFESGDYTRDEFRERRQAAKDALRETSAALARVDGRRRGGLIPLSEGPLLPESEQSEPQTKATPSRKERKSREESELKQGIESGGAKEARLPLGAVLDLYERLPDTEQRNRLLRAVIRTVTLETPEDAARRKGRSGPIRLRVTLGWTDQ